MSDFIPHGVEMLKVFEIVVEQGSRRLGNFQPRHCGAILFENGIVAKQKAAPSAQQVSEVSDFCIRINRCWANWGRMLAGCNRKQT